MRLKNCNCIFQPYLRLEKEGLKVKKISKIANKILSDFNESNFFKVLPNDYAKIMSLIKDFEKANSKDPLMDAFTKAMEVK